MSGGAAQFRWSNSLRVRLTLSTFAVSALALAATRLDLPADPPAWLRVLAIEPYQDALVIAAFTAVLLGALWLVSAWTLRPLAAASAEAAAAGPANPGARLTEAGLPAELRPLAAAVNGALDRLAQALAAEQRLVARAAHELRTPLAVLDLRLRRARETGVVDWAVVEADLAALTRRVAQLLDLARLEHQRPAMAPVNLARIARETAAGLMPLAEAAGRRLDVTLPDEWPMVGRAGDLADLLRNLLENALRHGAGRIWLAGDGAALTVRDEGGGIAAAAREAVFAPFASGRGGGAGLGLAIVREVARAHGAAVRVLDGPGCAVEVRFAAVGDG